MPRGVAFHHAGASLLQCVIKAALCTSPRACVVVRSLLHVLPYLPAKRRLWNSIQSSLHKKQPAVRHPPSNLVPLLKQGLLILLVAERWIIEPAAKQHMCRHPHCGTAACVALTCSGLSMEERQLVESAYSSGAISVLCCTSTMAGGLHEHLIKGKLTRSEQRQTEPVCAFAGGQPQIQPPKLYGACQSAAIQMLTPCQPTLPSML